MPRKSLIHYIAPSAFGITPNCNSSENDLDVFLARGTKIKVCAPKCGIGSAEDLTFQEWTLRGRNRRLADSSKPYTIYARLPKADRKNGYLVFAPKQQQGGYWKDKYSYPTVNGMATGYSGESTVYWYIRIGDVSLPSGGKRTVTFDTGALGTDGFNIEWLLNPDDLKRILLTCTIDDRDAGSTPYVYWDKTLHMEATMLEGWEDNEIDHFAHWEITRNSGDSAADTAWAAKSHVRAFANTGVIDMTHMRNGTDDFNGCVASTFKVIAWGAKKDNTIQLIASTNITILAETVEKYELSPSTVIVSYNPQTKTYSPEGGVAVRIRATDQRGDAFRITREQFQQAGLSLAYAMTESEDWQPLALDDRDLQEAAVCTIPITVFAAQHGIEVRLNNADGKELTATTIAFVRDGEDSREREWIFQRSNKIITYGDAESENPKPSLIPQGQVSPEGIAAGTDTNKQQDDWVPNGWTDDSQGTSEEFLYEYGSYRDWVRSVDIKDDDDSSEPAGSREGHWGEFTTPRIWSHYGEDAVTYDLIPSVSVISANMAGVINSIGITLKAYKTEGRNRSENILPDFPDYDYPEEGDYYYAEYCVDGSGEWRRCGKFTYVKEIVGEMEGYGIPADVVNAVREDVVFRLYHSSAPDVVLKESVPINVVRSAKGEDFEGQYLSKAHDDEAYGLIGFLKGLWVGIKDRWQWTPDGDITANNIVTEGNVTVGKILKAFQAYINKVQSTNYSGDGLLDTGWRITNEYEGGNSKATFDYLTIRKKAFFNELEIRKLTSIGGNFCLSPASGTIYRIEWFDGGGELLGYDYYNVPWTVGGKLLGLFSKNLAQRFLGKRRRLARRLSDEERQNMRRIRCYFYTDDGTTQTMLNWTVGAQARCQTFNIEEQMEQYSGGQRTNNDDVGFYDSEHRGEEFRTETDMYGGTEFYRGQKVQNTYWWRLVTAVGKARLDDGTMHHYVEFMVNTGSDRVHEDAGSDLPSVGDKVVQFGHRTRQDQQSVIMFETASEDAPAIKMYDGINSWDLNKRLVARMSPKGWKVMASKFEWMTAYGENSPTIIRGLWVDITPDANGKRRCYYNDIVAHNGSWWRCIVNEGTHKEDAAMTHWYTQEEIDHMSLEEQLLLIDVPNYTTIEPGDATWEQKAVWQIEIGQQIAPYLVIQPALFAVPCEKTVKATDAYSVSASVMLMVTNLEATIESIRMDGADANVKLSGNYVSVNFAKGASVPNKDYTITVDGTLNGQHYTAVDKISVYAIVKGNDAYEIRATPHQWLWNQAGANYTYQDIMDMIEHGTSPSDFGIEIDKVEQLQDGSLGNSCAQISITNAGVAQPFQIVSVAVSNTKVTVSYNNVTGRVWVTSVPNTLESGYVDVTLRYGSGFLNTLRIPFWCNLLGTWREIILGDTRASIAEKTEYYVQENNKALQTYQNNLNTAKKELNDVITANETARDETDQIMKDGLITDEEKGQLKAIKKTLQSEYDEALGAYNPVYNDANLKGTAKTALATAKSEMDTAYTNVINKITELMGMTKISKDGADAVNATFDTFKAKLQAYRRAIETASGAISGNAAAAAAATAKSELQDVITANENARNETDRIMKDGLITDEEKGQLKAIKKTLKSEYDEAIGAYSPVYNNSNLTGAQKSALSSAKTAMDAAYTAVINKIDELLGMTAISKDGADAVNATFNAFSDKLKAYRTALETATNQIINNGDSALNTKYTDFRAEYLQSSKMNSAKFSAISGTMELDGTYATVYDDDGNVIGYVPNYKKTVTSADFGTFKQSATENINELKKVSNAGELNLAATEAWERKTTSERSGATYNDIKTDSTTRICTVKLVAVPRSGSVFFSASASGYKVGLTYFGSGLTCLNNWSGYSELTLEEKTGLYKATFQIPSSAYYAGIVLIHKNEGSITTTVPSAINLCMHRNELVTKSYVNSTASDVSLGVQTSVEGKLYDTGIDIKGESRKIDLRANKVTFSSSDGKTTGFSVSSEGGFVYQDLYHQVTISPRSGNINIFNGSLYANQGTVQANNVIANFLQLGSAYNAFDNGAGVRNNIIWGLTSDFELPEVGDAPSGTFLFIKPGGSKDIKITTPSYTKIMKPDNSDLVDEYSIGKRSVIVINMGTMVISYTYHTVWALWLCD